MKLAKMIEKGRSRCVSQFLHNLASPFRATHTSIVLPTPAETIQNNVNIVPSFDNIIITHTLRDTIVYSALPRTTSSPPLDPETIVLFGAVSVQLCRVVLSRNQVLTTKKSLHVVVQLRSVLAFPSLVGFSRDMRTVLSALRSVSMITNTGDIHMNPYIVLRINYSFRDEIYLSQS